jgi:hypothetical protein
MADSGFALSSKESVIFVRLSTDFEAPDLNFTDPEGRAWQTKLEPKE